MVQLPDCLNESLVGIYIHNLLLDQDNLCVFERSVCKSYDSNEHCEQTLSLGLNLCRELPL